MNQTSRQCAQTRNAILLPAILLGVYLCALLARFAGPLSLSYFTDDFFYYAQIARHLADDGHSTFNGLQQTNGYHPLWLAALAGVHVATGGGTLFLVATVLLVFALVGGFWLALRALQRQTSPGSPYNLPTLLFSLFFGATIARTGMEVGAVLFFLGWFWARMAARPIEHQSASEAFASGLLASLAILSRVDGLIAIVLYGALSLVAARGRLPALLRNGFFFGLGLLPVAAYVVSNKLLFDTLLPISGMAKNLKSAWPPSPVPVAWLFKPNFVNIVLTWPSLALGAAYLARALAGDARTLNGPQRVRLCVLLHPLLFLGALSVSGDWPLWTWYLYPFAFFAAVLGPAVLATAPARLAPGRRANWAFAAALALMAAFFARPTPGSVSILRASEQIAAFESTHKGVYAMGDRSGTVGYLLGSPLVQLEGLVGDRAFYEKLKAGPPLADVLRDYKIDYYVATGLPREQGCYLAREPSQAGPLSPTMRGGLCAEPVAVFENSGFETQIFDKSAWARAASAAR
jgi:hypothetical protein